MKTLFTFLLLSVAAHADVRFCEPVTSQDVTVVACPQTLNTLLFLAPLQVNAAPGVVNLSLKTSNPLTTGFRVTMTYYRTFEKAEVSSITGFVDAGKLGEYVTLPLLTGRLSGIKSIEVVEIPPSVTILF